MDVDFVKTSIGSFKTRLKDREADAIAAIKDGYREADAIAAIKDGSYWTAQIALNECAGFKAVIEELEFQLELMEVDDD